MKKIIVSFAFVGSMAMANHLGMAGCGLGSAVMGKDGQISAATTNGTAGSQTFGISSGTSNCTDTSHTAAFRLPLFIEGNRDALQADVAKGNGEIIAHLSGVLGCTDSQGVGQALKKNYSEIFKAQESEGVSAEILKTLKSDQKVAAQCKTLS